MYLYAWCKKNRDSPTHPKKHIHWGDGGIGERRHFGDFFIEVFGHPKRVLLIEMLVFRSWRSDDLPTFFCWSYWIFQNWLDFFDWSCCAFVQPSIKSTLAYPDWQTSPGCLKVIHMYLTRTTSWPRWCCKLRGFTSPVKIISSQYLGFFKGMCRASNDYTIRKKNLDEMIKGYIHDSSTPPKMVKQP